MRGSLTVFAAMSMMLIAAFLFALLEASRMTQLRQMAAINTESVLESVFAAYEVPMWENYQLLVFDSGRTSTKDAFVDWQAYALALGKENFSAGRFLKSTNLLQLRMERVDFENYVLLTDWQGKAYCAAVAAYMQNNLAEEAVKELCRLYQSEEETGFSGMDTKSLVDQASAALEQAKHEEEERKKAEELARKRASHQKKGQAEQPPLKEQKQPVAQEKSKIPVPEENPLDIARQIWTKGPVALIVENPSELSEKKLLLDSTVSHRKLSKGTAGETYQEEWQDRVLLAQYLRTRFGDYKNPNNGGFLAYEKEYLLAGKGSDLENLKSVLGDLLQVREAVNLAYLVTDAAKMTFSLELATNLAGASANPVVIAAVQVGILCAWALVESILELRALCAGDKVPLVKSTGQWNTDLLHLGAILANGMKARNCPQGVDYETCLATMLLTKDCGAICLHAMDLQELAIRNMENYGSFRMDHMVLEAEMTATYRYHSAFMGMEKLTKYKRRSFRIENQAAYSYRKAGV